MPDYSRIDWDQPVPAFDAFDGAWARSPVEVVALDPRLHTVVDLFREERTSARMAAAQFDLDLNPTYRFYLQRNRLPESPFFHDLFGSAPFARAVPAVGDLRWTPLTLNDSYEGRKIGRRQGMKLVNGWDAFAALASWLKPGGLHIDPDDRLSERQAFRLTLGVARAAFSGEMTEGSSYLSTAPWSDWFDAEGFDCSLVLIDHRRGRATVIMLTDSP